MELVPFGVRNKNKMKNEFFMKEKFSIEIQDWVKVSIEEAYSIVKKHSDYSRFDLE